jgi:hypothetical protein
VEVREDLLVAGEVGVEEVDLSVGQRRALVG